MSLPKYHINPDTGTVGKCMAKISCRFGGPSVHHPSGQDAKWSLERAKEREEFKAKQLPKGLITPLDTELYKLDSHSFTLPEGSWYLADPYLILGHRDQAGWNEIVESIEAQFGWEKDVRDPDKQEHVAVGATYNGFPIMALKTYTGEGLHWCVGPVRRLPSESGLLGFMPSELLESIGTHKDNENAKHIGVNLRFKEAPKVSRDENGVMIFGDGLGRGLIAHNNLIAESFNAFSMVDGHNNNFPTEETYEALTSRAQTWKNDPEGFYRMMKFKKPR